MVVMFKNLKKLCVCIIFKICEGRGDEEHPMFDPSLIYLMLGVKKDRNLDEISNCCTEINLERVCVHVAALTEADNASYLFTCPFIESLSMSPLLFSSLLLSYCHPCPRTAAKKK